MLSIIAVLGKNRELGKDNKLLWHIPGDLPRFKRITWGHPVIMGRKSHTTFQYNGGPLPGRTNIVITHDHNYHKEGFVIVHSLDEALSVAKKSPGGEETFVIGGGQVYAQAIDRADRLYLTIVDATADADTFFPDYWAFTKIIEKEERTAGDFRITYLTLERP
ncbi:MAG: dihydrofolate reductase [Candidatus Gottesmanbacteria bacterium GW2011_GWA2_47_9]|uniref:Dihydrofolate reductase n=1 Tax=Candidatus Gottesmanbacteria bacterium GW2011_GWA2_47_9 TaxID=1618445 RepID=A0A0G1U176_9BACT|nr:MAG: dihydrofolate reductase [Candidatus Gottesmanbacteria bacterium GW2011_GWA2_47_9]